MKTKLVRDIPIGVLMLVLYLWCYDTAMYLAGWPGFWKGTGIFFFSVLGWKLLNVGFDVIFGIQIADKNDKK